MSVNTGLIQSASPFVFRHCAGYFIQIRAVIGHIVRGCRIGLAAHIVIEADIAAYELFCALHKKVIYKKIFAVFLRSVKADSGKQVR